MSEKRKLYSFEGLDLNIILLIFLAGGFIFGMFELLHCWCG